MELLQNIPGVYFAIGTSVLYALAIAAAIDALLSVRSSQAAIAWAMSLLLFPPGALPIYCAFGSPRFRGYKNLLKRMNASAKRPARTKSHALHENPSIAHLDFVKPMEALAQSHFKSGNETTLVLDRDFFDAILLAIRNAKKTVYLAFYIVRADTIGQKIKSELIAAAARGVKVQFLYDEFGSFLLPRKYRRELRACGVDLRDFNTRRGLWNFFQVNFRNHRKIVVVDHEIAFVGGANIGDEYLGRNKRLGKWRDTQVRVKGPAVLEIESVFLTDWAWASETPVEILWEAPPEQGPASILTVHTGATEDPERCILSFMEVLTKAKQRLWLASPYFVPDDSIVQALNLAASRGLDVRLLLPQRSDHLLSWLASFHYLPLVVGRGVKIYKYLPGFLHEKVVLMDSELTFMGTANLDNRSMRLSFELMLAIADTKFASEVEAMFEDDFKKSREVSADELQHLPLPLRIGSSVARLFSPLL